MRPGTHTSDTRRDRDARALSRVVERAHDPHDDLDGLHAWGLVVSALWLVAAAVAR